MKLGDLVMHSDEIERYNRGDHIQVGMIVKITKSKTIFIMWPNQFYLTGCNDYSFNDRYVVISEQNQKINENIL